MDWLAFALPVEGSQSDLLRAIDILRRDVPTCRLEDRVGDVKARLEGTDWMVCGVVNEAQVLLGMLRGKCWEASGDEAAGNIMREGPSTIRPSEELAAVTGRMQKRNVSALFVTSSDGRLIGLLRRNDAEEALRTFSGRNS